MERTETGVRGHLGQKERCRRQRKGLQDEMSSDVWFEDAGGGAVDKQKKRTKMATTAKVEKLRCRINEDLEDKDKIKRANLYKRQ